MLHFECIGVVETVIMPTYSSNYICMSTSTTVYITNFKKN